MSDGIERDPNTGQIIGNNMTPEKGRAMNARKMEVQEEKGIQAQEDLLGSLGYDPDQVSANTELLARMALDGKGGSLGAYDRLRRESPDINISTPAKDQTIAPEDGQEGEGQCQTCKTIFGSPEGKAIQAQILQAIEARQKGGKVKVKNNPFNSLAREKK